jgi:hypothetical protein
MALIPLTQNEFAIIDDADTLVVSAFKWRLKKIKNSNLRYVIANTPMKDGKRSLIHLHRLIMGITDSKVKIDHKDGNGLNNTRDNLRLSTNSQNAYNAKDHKNNTSGFRGVTWDKRQERFEAKININGKKSHLGYFDTAERASKAYEREAKIAHGIFYKEPK